MACRKVRGVAGAMLNDGLLFPISPTMSDEFVDQTAALTEGVRHFAACDLLGREP